MLKRADGFFAYQLAVVIDDAAQSVTHIVRGADLIGSTARQIFLQQVLEVNTPTYAHVPIVTNPRGEKLSKQTNAPEILIKDAVKNLLLAFEFLTLNPPESLSNASLDECWQWAIKHWRRENLIIK